MRPDDDVVHLIDQAGRDFVNTPENVAIKDDTVYLSSIFKWYKKDFPKDILIWLQQFAAPELHAQLDTAATQGYEIKHVNYDWAVNDADS